MALDPTVQLIFSFRLYIFMKRLDDDNHKTHYFLKPKRRQLAPPTSYPSLLNLPPSMILRNNPFTTLLNGKELINNVNHRYQVYQNAWKRQLDRIDSIMNNANLDLFINLREFIRSDTPLIQLLKYSISERQGQLPVAFLQLSSNTANNLRILQEYNRHMAEANDNSKIINLSSKACANIKSTLREVVRQFLNLKEDDAISGHVNYDLDIVEEWWEKKNKDKSTDNSSFRIVIVLQDTNSINNHVVNQLVRLLHSYAHKLPIRLIMGISSSSISGWINSNLSNENRILVSGLKFRCADNKSLGYRVMNDLFLNFEDNSLLALPLLATVLLNRFENANNSIDTLVAQIKLCYMIHYYLFPLAGAEEVRTNGEQNSAKEGEEKDVKGTEDAVAVNGTKDPSEDFGGDLSQRIFIDTLRKLPSFKTFIEKVIYQRTVPVDTIRRYLSDDQSLLDLFTKSKREFWDYRSKISSRLQEARIGRARFETYKDIVAGKTDLPCIHTLLFHELFTLDGGPAKEGYIFEENFENLMTVLLRPNLRLVVEQGLDDCTVYLQNKLTSTEQRFNAPTLSVLFRVYKEAPVAINIYDFYLAFKLSLDRSALVEALELGTVDEEAWDRMAYSWFVQNCFELVMMGLLKEKPKGDYLEKAVWKSV